MENNKYPRGSEWRKWDLHVHTPASDGTGSPNEIVDTAISKGISVIAITDHHTAEYIDQVKDYAKDKDISIISGIEFRSEYGGRSVHFIAYFPEKNGETILDSTALHNLVLSKLGVSKTEIVAKGRECDSTLNEDDAFKKGMFLVQVDMKLASDIVHSLGGIISVHNGNKENGLDEEVKHFGSGKTNVHSLYESLGPLKEDLMKKYIDICDIGASDNERDRQFYLNTFNRPSIVCSDAHSYSDIGNSYTWIKADPTFEGLKQILYEPEARVRIQESKPEEKSVYYVIDSVNFDIDKKWKGTIQLNPNLNTIIGGRATGKSTLLKAIAKKVSNSSFSYKDDTEKDFLKEYIENISISWLDGQDSENRDIEMLPQGNMYDIARDTRKLDDLIQRIIKDTEYNKHIENYESKNAQCKESITSDILNLFSLQKQIKDMELSLREKGDKKGIKAEIGNLAKRIEELNKGIGVSDEELKQFQENKNKITNIEQCVKQFENDLFILKELKEQSILVPNYSEKFIDLSTDVKNSLSGIFQELKTKIDEEWKNKISNEEATLSRKIEEQRQSLDSIQNSELFKKCKQNEGNNKELNDAEEKLKEENGKLKDFEEIEKQLEERNKLKKEKIESIVSSHISYKTNIQELVELLKIEHDDVVIKTTFRFTDAKFRSFLEDRLNQRGLERQNHIKSLVDNYPNETETVCREFLCKALNDEIEYKNYNSNQSVVTEFFATNWFDYSFDLTYQKDTFSQMSDGKKAFVVLKLLLEFSNKKCPILIDQPEDSLDNRAIYNELVTYIRKKKTERQIILVTHNPNIVVGADAENVIVANQHGTDSLNENGMKFQYVNGSLEYTKKRPKDYDSKKDLVLTSQGIREHVCEILEGGEKAFQERENKYGFKQ